MRIGVISDSHGDQIAIRQIVKMATNIDMWLHAGDCSQDAEYLRSLVAVPVLAVRGNCDGQVAARVDEFTEFLTYKIWLTHGHRYGVKRGSDELLLFAKHHGMNIAVYGHTHIPDNRWCDGVLLFNPGSATCSYGSRGTYGVLEIDNNQVVGNIVQL